MATSEAPLLKRTAATLSDDMAVNYKLLHSPKFRALVVENVLSVTAFAFMARQTESLAGPEMETLNNCGVNGCGFTSFYQFKGVVGVYAAFWVYTVLLIGLYLFSRGPPPGTEFVVHALFTLCMIAFVSLSVISCTSTVIESDYSVCKNAAYAKASLVFAALVVVLNCATCAFVFKQWRSLQFVGMPENFRPFGRHRHKHGHHAGDADDAIPTHP
ncbi:unnamed product [Ostreococcus tauri]|uniref:CASP-like protein 0U1 n=2 Tax=Ostreococcus tauri TaxID=70448 RepID=CSPL1_OSTTA|nr:unnamed product [Ostreococcus tauri]Q00U99.3 RecName: Full=CASP-like protein 0U1; Short=OtCASPL0U1 [Ostreococcus tauri]OUS44296.1 hypothetical protein BE221DRAFT_117429 [Ostreococcus tauri]CEG00362.1 unnamed product [Ostreococcus tauri]|eukprot:XP_022840340.1 unnamed product [Ostreococcus tauri]